MVKIIDLFWKVASKRLETLLTDLMPGMKVKTDLNPTQTYFGIEDKTSLDKPAVSSADFKMEYDPNNNKAEFRTGINGAGIFKGIRAEIRRDYNDPSSQYHIMLNNRRIYSF
ncbi:MAG: hypothetical protein KKF46_04770 [Nanoarchaeota archaeon]|nr:hypothetical protein [Nanoarchaeota archaeon]MBU1321646.1 hypothetical protein [Nanoarchaeota archaeon]MBU1597148.1 hypothetical protein [Nanoarchaeota archaeon]MBU2442081.1 hypothetical protein [Nanoarchaeota archaeon]